MQRSRGARLGVGARPGGQTRGGSQATEAADAPTSAPAVAQELAAGYKKKDFKAAKFDFTDRMLEFSGVSSSPAKVLDVGCGIGGTTRHLAKKFGPGTELTGITLSPNQVRRFGQRFPWRCQAGCKRAD